MHIGNKIEGVLIAKALTLEPNEVHDVHSAVEGESAQGKE